MVKEAVIRVVKKNAGGTVARTDRLSEDRLDWHLGNWADWQRTGGVRSLGCVTSNGVSGSSDFDDMCLVSDRISAETVDVCIADLMPAQGAAVYHKHLYCVFRFPRLNLDDLYEQARASLSVLLFRKHLI